MLFVSKLVTQILGLAMRVSSPLTACTTAGCPTDLEVSRTLCALVWLPRYLGTLVHSRFFNATHGLRATFW